jgi:Polyketide cyclase / dehydrase and lipid transport
MLKSVLMAIVALVAGVFALGFAIPTEQTVARSVAVKAAPEIVYAQVANLRNWEGWAPWSARNLPAARFSYEGSEAGVGASMLWQGTDGRGGRLWLTSADAVNGIAFEMVLHADQRQKATGMIQIVPSGSETLVVWTWRARFNGPVERWKGLLVDEMLGPQFEDGLVQLKKAAEGEVTDGTTAEVVPEVAAVTPEPSVDTPAPPSGVSTESTETRAAKSEADSAPTPEGESNAARTSDPEAPRPEEVEQPVATPAPE